MQTTSSDENISCHEEQCTENSSFPGIRSLAAGAAGGVCSVLVGHPFDLIKVRLQTADRAVRKSALDVFKSSLNKEKRIRGIYAGVSAPLMGVTPIYAVSFWGYDVGKSLIRKLSSGTNPSSADLSIAQFFAAGMLSAAPMTLVSAPFERVKILLQVQGQKPHGRKQGTKAPSGATILRSLYRGGGIRSVYRGSLMTFARDAPDSAAYFATYEYCKKKFTPKLENGAEGSLSLLAVSVAGACAGIVMLIPLFPIDTVKSRLQAAEGKPRLNSTVKSLYRQGGVKAFFPGLGPALLRAIPANAAATLGWEVTRLALDTF